MPLDPTNVPASVNATRLVERAGQTEMHIGVHTETFGGIVLHTAVRDGNVGVAIGSERGDLADVLARDFSSLQDTLARNSVRLDDVKFFDLSGGASGFAGNRHPEVFTPSPPATNSYLAPAEQASEEVRETDTQLLWSRPGLSVLA